MNEDVRKTFLVNRDETGREVIFFPETGKKYYAEYIHERNHKVTWGDIDPATKKLTGSYGNKSTGSITEEESVITKENGFDDIRTGGGSPYWNAYLMHEEYKKTLKN